MQMRFFRQTHFLGCKGGLLIEQLGQLEPVPYDTSRCPVKKRTEVCLNFYEKVNLRKTLRPFWKVRA